MRRVLALAGALVGLCALPAVSALPLQGCSESCSLEATYPLEEGMYSLCAGGEHTFENSYNTIEVTLVSPAADQLEIVGAGGAELDDDRLSADLCNAIFSEVLVRSSVEVDYELLLSDANCADE